MADQILQPHPCKSLVSVCVCVNVGGVCGCKCVWVCARASVVHDYMSVIPRAKPIRQQPKPSKRFNFLAKTLKEDIAQALYKICQDHGLLGKILSSQQDRGLMGKILNSLPKCLGQELFAGCLLEVSPFVSATRR